MWPALLAGWVLAALLMSTDQAGAAGHAVFDVLFARSPVDLDGSNRSEFSWTLQKIIHVALFLTMGALAARAEETERRWVFCAGAIAIAAEALQSFTFSRSAEGRDAILNLLCVFAGYSLSRHTYRNVR